MRFAAVLVRHTRARSRLEAALASTLAPRDCGSVTELRELAFDPGSALVVAEPMDALGYATWPVLADIRRGFPSLPILGYCTLRASLATDVSDLARAGVHDCVLLDIDDTAAGLRTRIGKARSLGTAEWALREMAPVLAGAIEPIVHYCLANASRPITVSELATVLGADRKTLSTRCRDAGSPPPGNIVSWCRMLMAARLLEDAGRHVEHVALELGFPSAGSLRALLRRYLSMGVQEMRDAGGASFVVEALKHALAGPSASASASAECEELDRPRAIRVA